MAQFICRMARQEDFPVLADLRWRLKTDDADVADEAAYTAFVEQFVAFEGAQRSRGEAFHWVADSAGHIVAAMSVIVVTKPPAPGELDGRWGYLTNCYALPEVRSLGVGSGLLTAVKGWAGQEGLEMLVVWPSDRAFPFYRRAGFQRLDDPLVLNLTDGNDAA